MYFCVFHIWFVFVLNHKLCVSRIFGFHLCIVTRIPTSHRDPSNMRNFIIFTLNVMLDIVQNTIFQLSLLYLPSLAPPPSPGGQVYCSGGDIKVETPWKMGLLLSFQITLSHLLNYQQSFWVYERFYLGDDHVSTFNSTIGFKFPTRNVFLFRLERTV